MIRQFAVFAVCFINTIPVGFGEEKPDTSPVEGLINWVYDYDKGQRLSLQQDKPMFVVFRCER